MVNGTHIGRAAKHDIKPCISAWAAYAGSLKSVKSVEIA
jgi:hypothetical protein